MPRDCRTLMKVHDALYAAFGPQRWWPGETPLEIIVGAVLTQNTAWSNVEKAIENLRAAGALRSAAGIRDMPHAKLAKLIRPAGYFNIKARRLRNCMVYVARRLGLDKKLSRAAKVPTETLREELLAVNGIGQETADSILLYALDRPLFVVDAYTKRIFTRLGLLRGHESYHEIQKLFVDTLPEDRALFNEYHALIVRLGKDFCHPTRPRCTHCPLNNICSHL